MARQYRYMNSRFPWVGGIVADDDPHCRPFGDAAQLHRRGAISTRQPL